MSANTQNESWVLASRPGADGMCADNFRLEQTDMPAALETGEVLLRSTFLSVDPYMRGRMDDLQGKKSYFSAPFALNESPAGTMGAEVIGSESDDFAIGDIVTGFLPWQRYIKVDGKAVSKKDTSKIPLEKYLSSVSYSGLSVSALCLQTAKTPKRFAAPFRLVCC